MHASARQNTCYYLFLEGSAQAPKKSLRVPSATQIWGFTLPGLRLDRVLSGEALGFPGDGSLKHTVGILRFPLL